MCTLCITVIRAPYLMFHVLFTSPAPQSRLQQATNKAPSNSNDATISQTLDGLNDSISSLCHPSLTIKQEYEADPITSKSNPAMLSAQRVLLIIHAGLFGLKVVQTSKRITFMQLKKNTGSKVMSHSRKLVVITNC